MDGRSNDRTPGGGAAAAGMMSRRAREDGRAGGRSGPFFCSPMWSPMAAPLGVLVFYAYTFAGVRADQPGCHPACNLDFNCTAVPLGVVYSDDLMIKCKNAFTKLPLAVDLTTPRCLNACRWDEAEKDQPIARTRTQGDAGIGQEHCRVHADYDRSRRAQLGRATGCTDSPLGRR